MARTRRKTKRKRGPSLLTRLGGLIGAVSWWGVCKVVLNVAVLAGLAAAAVVGLPRLEMYVSGLPEYQHELEIRLVDPPAWLAANQHIVRDIVQRSGVHVDDTRLTPGLARRVADELTTVGWVRRVHEVSVGNDDVVRICCDYREPIAWVSHGSFYYLVDAEGTRLPGRYSHGEVTRDSGLLLVAGVASEPSDEGQAWEGDDLSAAIEMVVLLRDKPYYEQLTGVLVGNYGGRKDPRRAHIELATDRGSRIRWGRAPGEEIDEPTVEQKLAHLQGIWRDHDRIDMGKRWVDIQVWPDQVLVPAGTWQSATGQRS